MNIMRLAIPVIALCLCFGEVAYAKNDKHNQLPPGLQKKVQSGKSLPPGWQKKLAVGETLDKEVYDHGNIVLKDSDKGLITVNIEGKIIRVIENTREIVEILEGL